MIEKAEPLLQATPNNAPLFESFCGDDWLKLQFRGVLLSNLFSGARSCAIFVFIHQDRTRVPVRDLY